MAFGFLKKSHNAPTIDSISTLHFSYSTGTMINSQVSYDVECKKECTAAIKPDGVPTEAAKTISLNDEAIKQIIALLNDNSVVNWDGFNKSDQDVLDGNSFSFSLSANQGEIKVSAHGYMKWPDHYTEVRDGFDSIFGGTFSEAELTELRGY